MYFTPQQLSGGPRYGFKTRVGNWVEDWEKHETKLKDYMSKKDGGALVINSTQQKYAKSFQHVAHTYREDKHLHFDDFVQMKCVKTSATLVCDMSDRITTHDEAYCVTSTTAEIGPMARSIFRIVRAKKADFGDSQVRYGMEVRLMSNPHINNKDLFLHSVPITPLAYARFSRNQEVCLHVQPTYNTVWRIMPTPGNGFYNDPVRADVPVIFEHCQTQQFLSNDHITYRNDFGNELEVSAKALATNSKTQILIGEQTGMKTRESCPKAVPEQNHWTFVLADSPAAAESQQEAEPRYSAEKMIQDIKETLKKRGAMMIRGIARVFRILDDNKNKQIDSNELLWGLKDFDIHLNEEQVAVLMKHFDTDGSGTINFDEFLVALRGELNESRLSYIRGAYDKLDVNKDGQVTLDDVAKLYDVSQHPDVQSGKCTPEEAYLNFMKMWDTQKADGIVTFDEFCTYMKDVSASIDSDEYFGVMMTNAWKL